MLSFSITADAHLKLSPHLYSHPHPLPHLFEFPFFKINMKRKQNIFKKNLYVKAKRNLEMLLDNIKRMSWESITIWCWRKNKLQDTTIATAGFYKKIEYNQQQQHCCYIKNEYILLIRLPQAWMANKCDLFLTVGHPLKLLPIFTTYHPF